MRLDCSGDGSIVRLFAGVHSYLKATREEIGGDLQPLQKIPLCVEDFAYLVTCWRPNTLLESEAQVQCFNAALFMLSGLRSGAIESEQCIPLLSLSFLPG